MIYIVKCFIFNFQPALLYIVPLCLIFPLTVALIQGDLKSMFTYRDHEDQEKTSKTNSNNTSTSSTTVILVFAPARPPSQRDRSEGERTG